MKFVSTRRWLRNTIGTSLGYGRCMRCGDSWWYKKTGHVSYSDNRGMFPVCQECQDSISKYELYDYCRELAMKWFKDYMRYEKMEKIMDGVKKTLGVYV